MGSKLAESWFTKGGVVKGFSSLSRYALPCTGPERRCPLLRWGKRLLLQLLLQLLLLLLLLLLLWPHESARLPRLGREGRDETAVQLVFCDQGLKEIRQLRNMIEIIFNGEFTAEIPRNVWYKIR